MKSRFPLALAIALSLLVGATAAATPQADPGSALRMKGVKSSATSKPAELPSDSVYQLPLKLTDQHGNTFEWCRDWYHPKLPGGTDPDLYNLPARSRVRRGGCWADEGWPCRSAFRLRFEPERRYDHIGFRAVLVQS